METKKRILAIDLARGMSVLMLVVIHTLWMYGTVETQENTWVGHAIHFIGKGTPMFLIAMGISFTISRNQSLVLSIKRGFMLLGLGYFMNFMKFIVPILFGFMPENFIEAYGWSSPVTFGNMFYLILIGDILQLASMSLFFMGVINHFAKNKYIPLVIAFAIMLLTPVVRGVELGVPGVDYVCQLLWDSGWHVYFAVFPWFSFILIGMFLGMWLKEKDSNVNFIFTRMLYVGLVLLVIGGAATAYNFEYHFGDYFHLGPGGAIYLAGINLILYWMAHIVTSKIKHNKVFGFIYYSSKRVTSIYIIQWILVCWGMGIFGFQQLGVTGVLLMIPVLTVITYLVQAGIEKALTARKSHRQRAMA